eukprot:8245559-Pyramimonas_sp.AAC.1
MTLRQPRRGQKPAQIMGMQGYIDEAKAADQFKMWAERYAQGEETVTLEAERQNIGSRGRKRQLTRRRQRHALT